MTKKEDKNLSVEGDNSEFAKLLEQDNINVPQIGDIVKGEVVTASKSEVRLDIDGVLVGVVRGPELYDEAEEYAHLKPGDTVEANVVDEENENGELELSFRIAGQAKAWDSLRESFKDKEPIKVKIMDANKGGLLARYCQIQGFLPVSQLAPENYPRVSGGDKSKILEKLKSFVAEEFEVTVMTLDEDEDKIIFSEKDIWSKKQKDVIGKYKVGTVVDGSITAVTNFGVFVNFGENMEGLIHISELAWQRIDSPSDLFKVGDKIKAEVINVDGVKIFLSAKKLIKDPWQAASEKYKNGQIVKGQILKINPFGLFVKLDNDIHGLAHASQLNLAPGQKINELFKENQEINFEIMSIEPAQHRLGLKLVGEKTIKKEKDDKSTKKDNIEKEEKNDKSEKKDDAEKEEKTSEKEKPKKEKKEIAVKKETKKEKKDETKVPAVDSPQQDSGQAGQVKEEVK